MMKKETLLKILVFIGLSLIVFINNGSISLWDQDEAAYAGFAKHMLESGDFIEPQFPWSDVHRKPPLHFWLIALAYKIFGINEFAVRFFVALSLIGVYLMIYFFGRNLIGDKAAFYSSIVLGTSFFAPLLGKVAVTDGLLLFFHTLAGFSLLKVLLERSWKYVFWFYVAVGFGLLVKGPPILIFTGWFVIILFALHPSRKNLLILHPWFFGWLALAPLVIWGYLAWKQNPQFINWLIDWYILRRVSGSVFGQTGPIGYYIVSIALFFSAYFAFFPAALKNAISSFWQKEKNQWFLIGAWMVAGWLFYEFLKSKLPAYVIAAYPGFAMALGYQMWLSEQNKNKDFKLIKISAIFHLIIAIAVFAGVVIATKEIFDKASYGQALAIVTVYLMLTIYGLSNIWLQKIKQANKILMLNAGIFVFLFFAILLPKIDYYRNAPYQVAQYAKTQIQNPSYIIIGNSYGEPPSLIFYLQTNYPNAELIITENIQIITQYIDTQDNILLILSQKQAKIIQQKYPQLYIKHIETAATDRPGKLSYYIIVKKENKN